MFLKKQMHSFLSLITFINRHYLTNLINIECFSMFLMLQGAPPPVPPLLRRAINRFALLEPPDPKWLALFR